MVTIINDLKEIFRRGDIHIRLIFINTIIFLAVTLMQIALLLFNVSISEWLRWVELPASLSQFISQPWSIITYMFMHAGVMHLLFNMLWLYWFGQLFLYFFTAAFSFRGGSSCSSAAQTRAALPGSSSIVS